MNKRTFVLLAFLLLGALSCDMGNVAGLVGGAKPTPAANVSVIVNVTTPLDDSTVPLNSNTAIQVEGLSTQPITTLELWVDGALFASKTVPPSGQNRFFASWGWMPTAAGDHTLFVRAGDATHPSVDSNPVHVTASADANSTIAVNYPVKPGDTVQSIAQKSDATPQQIIDLNPQINPSNPITPGLTISVPLPMPGTPATPISPTVSSAPPPLPLPPPPPLPPSGTPGTSPNVFAIPFKLSAAKLIASLPVDQVYCYLSVDGAPATRLPPAPNTFITPVNGQFDVSDYLHSLTFAPGVKTITLSLDCSGWKGGILVPLGQAKQTIDPYQPSGPIVLLGGNFKLNANMINKLNAITVLGGPAPDSTNQIRFPFIFPPTGLDESTDPSVCGLFGGIFCTAAIQNHQLLLRWEWSPDMDPASIPANRFMVKDIDGYRVFENDLFFQHQLIATSHGADAKWALPLLPPKPSASSSSSLVLKNRYATSPRCFVVRAFQGALESADSSQFCLSGAIPGTKTATPPLKPTLFKRSANRVDHEYVLSLGCGLTAIGEALSPGEDTEAGFYHQEDSCVHHNAAIRGLVQFDPIDFTNGPVSSAMLSFHLVDTVFADNVDGNDKKRLAIPPETLTNMSCATELWTATQDWSQLPAFPGENQNDLVNGNILWVLPRNQSDWTLDVTSAVRSWQVNQGTNFGFVLKTFNEDTAPEDNDECVSGYNNFQIDMTFFPS